MKIYEITVGTDSYRCFKICIIDCVVGQNVCRFNTLIRCISRICDKQYISSVVDVVDSQDEDVIFVMVYH